MGKLTKLALVIAAGYGIYFFFFQPDWYPAGSAEEGFTIEFPEPPKRDTSRYNHPQFGLVSSIQYTYRKGYDGFWAIVMSSRHLKEGQLTEKQIEEGALEHMQKAVKGRLISAESTMFRGVPAVDMEYRLDSSSATMYLRLIFTDGKVYLFGSHASTFNRFTNGRQRFFRSVRFPQDP